METVSNCGCVVTVLFKTHLFIGV